MNQNLLQRAITRVMPAAIRTGLYVSLATFQSSDAADFPDGFYSGNFQPLPGLANLPCMRAPSDPSFIQATEVKGLKDIMSEELLDVTFTTYYTVLDAGWRDGWRIVLGDNDGAGNLINPVNYDLLGVGVDSQSQHSVAKARLVTI